MIIDLILDRKEGNNLYSAKRFYDGVSGYGDVGVDIASAMDGGENEDVQRELCNYIKKERYNEKICEYVMGKRWV